MINLVKSLKKINTLENQVATLEDTIKNELYKEFIGKIKDYDELIILREENKKLKKKIKILKEMLKEGK